VVLGFDRFLVEVTLGLSGFLVEVAKNLFHLVLGHFQVLLLASASPSS
jgi:hypothetical protein